MSRKCSVCSLPKPERGEVDSMLIAGQSLQSISQNPRFLTKFSYSSLFRHRAKHIPAKLAKAQEASEALSADALLRQVMYLQKVSLSILQKAEDSNPKVALAAIREARGNVELLGRILGELRETGPTIGLRQQTIYVSDETMRDIRDYARTLVQRGEIPGSFPRRLDVGVTPSGKGG